MCAAIEMDSQAVSLATGGKKKEGEPERRCERKKRDGMVPALCWPRYVSDLSAQPRC